MAVMILDGSATEALKIKILDPNTEFIDETHVHERIQPKT